MITQRRLKQLLDYNPNSGVFTWLVPRANNKIKAGTMAGGLDAEGYTIIGVDGSPYKAHRLAWYFTYGNFPNGVIDHVDKNPSNNRIKNLRDVSTRVNSQNAKKYSTNKSGVTGVRSRTMLVNGKIYKYQVVNWKDIKGVKQQKCFNEGTYGAEVAKALAVALREEVLLELNRQGLGYTDGHGK